MFKPVSSEWNKAKCSVKLRLIYHL